MMEKDQVRTAGHPNPGGVEKYPGIKLVRVVMRELIQALVNESVLTIGWLATADEIEKMDASNLTETLAAMICDLYDEGVLTFNWFVRSVLLRREKDWAYTIKALIGLMYELHLDSCLEYDWLEYMELLRAAFKEAKNSANEKRP